MRHIDSSEVLLKEEDVSRALRELAQGRCKTQIVTQTMDLGRGQPWGTLSNQGSMSTIRKGRRITYKEKMKEEEKAKRILENCLYFTVTLHLEQIYVH